MSSSLPPVPVRTQLIDAQGFLHPIWSDWLQKVFVRTGGNTAPTNDELNEVGPDRILATVAGAGIAGGAGSPLSVNADGTTLEVATDQIRIKDSGVNAAKITDGVIGFIKFLSTDWTSNTAASGYLKLPSGFYLQWGVTGSFASATTTTVTFPVAFPTACRQVIAGIQGNNAGATAATGHFGTGNYSVSGFELYNRTSATYTFNYLAVGY
jgi:hypothetical protein